MPPIGAIPGRRQPARLLVVPGLHNSGPTHWQSWLETLHHDARRVTQHDWAAPELDRWAGRIASTLEREAGTRWIAVAHSFGCLALTRLSVLRPDLPIEVALLVAPADPDRFGVAGLLPQRRLPFPSTLVASDTDPWLAAARAQHWARRWGSHGINLGDAGHINAEAGYGPFPLAQHWIAAAQQRLDDLSAARMRTCGILRSARASRCLGFAASSSEPESEACRPPSEP